MKKLILFILMMICANAMMAQEQTDSLPRVFVYTFEGGTSYDVPAREQVVAVLMECGKVEVVSKEDDAEYLVDGLVQLKRDYQKNTRSTDDACFLFVTLVAGTPDGNILYRKCFDAEGKGATKKAMKAEALSSLKQQLTDEIKKVLP